jgi:single-stranded-DNA-specific exonuclease
LTRSDARVKRPRRERIDVHLFYPSADLPHGFFDAPWIRGCTPDVARVIPGWIEPLAADGDLCRQFVHELGLAPFVAELLCRRGLGSVEQAAQFIDPKLRSLGDPFLLPNMAMAVERILVALRQHQRIVLYGDYDVDGVSSLALLTRVLRAFGGAPHCFLPMRLEEGYGLTADGVARCVATFQPELLIAVDCGTSSAAEIAALVYGGVDVIVLDHHTCKDVLPSCGALVNPKLGSDHHYLCSVGIVFKLAHALLKRSPLDGFDLREYLDLVALGTVADLVPIAAENRVLVKRGLRQLEETKWVGLRALLDVAGLRPPLNCRNISFGLAPRLNAAGRLGTAQDALELLLTEDPARARALAQSLDEQNRERRAVEDEVFAQAEAQLAKWFNAQEHAAIVVGDEGWHPGVVGIVASRLLKRYHRPTLVIGFDKEGFGKGSGRSIDGLSLVQALGQCGELLERFGGHEMAAGITMRHAHFTDFRDVFARCARSLLTAEQLQPSLRPEAEVRLREIDYDLLVQHEALQPFGIGNPQPLLFARGVTLVGSPRLIKDKHLSFYLRQDGSEHRAVWFRGAEVDLPPVPWDVAFHLERNEYHEQITPQIEVQSVRSSAFPTSRPQN